MPTAAKLAELTAIRDALRAEMLALPFGHPGRDRRCDDLHRVIRQIRDLTGE